LGWLWKLLIWLAPLGAGVVAFINTSLAGCESFSFGARGRSECFADAGSGALDQSSAGVLLIIGVVWAILFPIGLWFWGSPQVLGSLDPSQDSTPPTTRAKPTGHATEMSKSDRDRYLWIGRRADALMSEGVAVGPAYERAARENERRPAPPSHSQSNDGLGYEGELTPFDRQVFAEAEKLMDEYGFSSDDAFARAARNVRNRQR
jgi:hypothetical protein